VETTLAERSGVFMLTLYGSARSRAARSLVALEELSLAYRHEPLNPSIAKL